MKRIMDFQCGHQNTALLLFPCGHQNTALLLINVVRCRSDAPVIL
jgi:hypothetical protein